MEDEGAQRARAKPLSFRASKLSKGAAPRTGEGWSTLNPVVNLAQVRWKPYAVNLRNPRQINLAQ